MLTQEQINEAVKDAMPSVLQGLRNEIAEQALREARQVVSTQIQSVVTAWFTSEVVPEVKAALVESKAGLIAVAPQFADQLSASLVKAMTEGLQKRLESTWERKKILEAMFA